MPNGSCRPAQPSGKPSMAVRPRSSGGRTALLLALALAVATAGVVIWWGGALWPAAPVALTDPGSLTVEDGLLPPGLTVVLETMVPPETLALPLRLTGRFAEPMVAGGPPRHEWPAVHAEARFEGPALSVAFDDDGNRYRLTLDRPALRLVIDRPGRRDLVLAGLGSGAHAVRLEKISESAAPRPFPVLYPGPGALSLPAPAAGRQIEVIGDSEAVGYGILSSRRDCSDEEQFAATDTSLGFGPALARDLGADYRLVARSGMGLVRNYGGADAGRSLSALYPLVLPSDPMAEPLPGDWSPALVVLQLGTNDLSDSDPPGLPPGYAEAADELLHRLRATYPGATLLVMPTLSPDAGRRAALEPVIADLTAAGGAPVALVDGPDSELTACHWHPSLRDHAAMTKALERTLARLPDPWSAATP